MRVLNIAMTGMAMLVGLACLKPSVAQAMTRSAILPVRGVHTAGPLTYTMYRCSSFASCIFNLNEVADGDIGVGIFSTRPGDWVSYVFERITLVSPTNWHLATGVNSVEAIVGLQSTGGDACTNVRATAEEIGGSGIATSADYCIDDADPARLYSFKVNPSNRNQSWSVALLNNTKLYIAVTRSGTQGPRGYVANMYYRVSYEAP